MQRSAKPLRRNRRRRTGRLADRSSTTATSRRWCRGDECDFTSGSATQGLSFYEGRRVPGQIQRRALLRRLGPRLHLRDVARGRRQARPSTVEPFMRERQHYPGVEDQRRARTATSTTPSLFGERLGDGEIHRIAYRPTRRRRGSSATPPLGVYVRQHEFETDRRQRIVATPTANRSTYEWDLDEDGSFETEGGGNEDPDVTEAEQETGEGTEPNRCLVRVEDEKLTSVARITVYPGDKPPVPTITKPQPSLKWKRRRPDRPRRIGGRRRKRTDRSARSRPTG